MNIMNKEKLELLFKLVMNDIVLNYEILINYGFTDEDIIWMKQNATIIECKNGIYRFIAIDKLRKYGLKLLYEEYNAKDANICFRKCYYLAPGSRKVCMQYMMALVRRYEYKEALEVYDRMIRKESHKYEKDNNLILYLFSVLTELDPLKADKVTSFKLDDLLMSRHYNHKDENEVRKAVFNNKFTYAYKLNNVRACNEKEGYSVKLELIKSLLAHAIEAERNLKSYLLDLAKNDEYEKIITILCKREEQKNLSRLENYIMVVCDSILEIINTGKNPVIVVYNTDNMYDALLGNNFELAYRLNKEFLLRDGCNPDNDIVNVLLLKINNMISENFNKEYEVFNKRRVLEKR